MTTDKTSTVDEDHVECGKKKKNLGRATKLSVLSNFLDIIKTSMTEKHNFFCILHVQLQLNRYVYSLMWIGN